MDSDSSDSIADTTLDATMSVPLDTRDKREDSPLLGDREGGKRQTKKKKIKKLFVAIRVFILTLLVVTSIVSVQT